jgi:tRNA A-37 threonylcarbamoyl transferase component Bud32/Flp pilus assembly protein TadD
MSVNQPPPPPRDPENEGQATTNYDPHDPGRTSVLPPSPSSPGPAGNGSVTGVTAPLSASAADPDLTEDLSASQADPNATEALGPVPRPVTDGPAGEVTDADVMTGDYTPGGTPTEAAATPGSAPRVRTDRYALKRFHAKGGMGEIWLAEDCDVGRAVALKRMRRKGSPEEQERFLREARITGQLEHPGIVPVHELGSDEHGQPVYVMKFVHGRTLSDAIKAYHKGEPNPEVPREVQLLRLLEVFVALCQTVAYAHSRGVLHRDIKPDNVMLGPYGETLVLDWGLAKLVGQAEGKAGGVSLPLSTSGESLESVAGSVRGTPAYMPPEMAGGQVEDIDQLSDVYLLGATLYQILTGRQPRRGKSLPELLKEAMTNPPAEPRALDPTIPKPLEAVCQKAMAWAKADRYQSADALAEDLQRYLAGESVSAYRETLAERAWRWAKRHRTALTRGGLAAVIVVVAAIGFAVLRDQIEARHAAERKAAEEAEAARRKDEARNRLAEFRDKADETQFYLASVNPTTEQAAYFDPGKGMASGRDALARAARLADLPLADDERDEVKGRQYDLLLLLTQARVLERSEEAAHEGADWLARAEQLRPASAGLHRLRARCYELLKDDRADEERRAAEAGDAPPAALDYFLLGNEDRVEAFRPPAAPQDLVNWQPSRALLTKALGEYREAVRLEPAHFWAHFQVGGCLLSLGRNAEALEALGTCVALRRESPWGYASRALALANLKRYAEARADLDQAVKLDPEQTLLRLRRAEIAWQEGGADSEKQALADLGAVLEAPPGKRLVEAAFSRGQIYLLHDRRDEALRDLDMVAAEKPDFRPVHRLRATLHFRMKDKDKALDDLNAYLAAGRDHFDPKSAEACEGRGRLLLLLTPDLPPEERPTALTQALAEMRRASELGNRSAALLNDYASLLDSLEEYPLAVEKYTEALKQKPDDAKIQTKRGWALVNSKKLAEAEADFAAVLSRNSSDKEAHTGLGYVHALRQATGPALREAQWATFYGAGDYGILHNVACIYAVLARGDPVRRKDYEDLALDALRRALDLWKRGGKTEPNELDQIEGESAFKPDLCKRQEFKDLIAAEKR